MSFVTVASEEVSAASGRLAGIGSALAAQDAAAAAPTTGVVPAAADQVSVLQAAQFSAYGQLYQQVSAQAQAIHQMFVHTLSTSSGTYAATEAANSASASSSGSGIWNQFINFLSNSGPLGLSSNTGSVGMSEVGNWASAYSDCIGLGSGGLLTALASEASQGMGAGGMAAVMPGAVLADAVAPASSAASAASAGVGGMPVLASAGQASAIGGLSVPPSWAGGLTPVSNAAPATLVGQGWATGAPHSAPVASMPTGMPTVGSAGRGGLGLGAPRYGVKPTVMPKPAVV